MTRWSEIAPVVPVKIDEKREARRRAASIGASFVVHASLLILVWSAQSGLLTKPEQIEPDVPLIFTEPTSPPPPPSPQLMLPRLPLPKARPAPPPAPATAAPKPDDRPLLGWTSHGDKPAILERPPGPVAKTLGPGEPDKGKGMKDGESGSTDELARTPTPPPTPMTPEAGAQQDPPSPFGEVLRRQAPGPERASGTHSAPKWPGAPSGGRRGRAGSGEDYNVGMGGGAFGDVSFESGDFDWSDYSTKVYFAVYRAWLRELEGRVTRFERDQLTRRLPDLDGETAIRFVLRRDGSVDSLETLETSPMPSLDESASAALRRAVLPPLPSDFPRDSERVIFRFRMSGFETAQQLQHQLDYSRARGDF